MKKETKKSTPVDKDTKPISEDISEKVSKKVVEIVKVVVKKTHRHKGVDIEVGQALEVTPKQRDFLKSNDII